METLWTKSGESAAQTWKQSSQRRPSELPLLPMLLDSSPFLATDRICDFHGEDPQDVTSFFSETHQIFGGFDPNHSIQLGVCFHRKGSEWSEKIYDHLALNGWNLTQSHRSFHLFKEDVFASVASTRHCACHYYSNQLTGVFPQSTAPTTRWLGRFLGCSLPIFVGLRITSNHHQIIILFCCLRYPNKIQTNAKSDPHLSPFPRHKRPIFTSQRTSGACAKNSKCSRTVRPDQITSCWGQTPRNFLDRTAPRSGSIHLSVRLQLVCPRVSYRRHRFGGSIGGYFASNLAVVLSIERLRFIVQLHPWITWIIRSQCFNHQNSDMHYLHKTKIRWITLIYTMDPCSVKV